MSKSDTREALLRQRIAANMAYYRKMHNLTQSELAERLSYSDKSVSKWERAEGVPDIYVLTLMAELFNVTVDDLVSENAPLPPVPEKHVNKNRVMILLMSIGLAWLVATVAYTALQVFAPQLDKAWYSFVLAIPASCIIAVVFTSLWWDLKYRFLSVSALVWSVAAAFYVTVPLSNMDLIFAVSAVLQLLVILWFLFLRQLRKIESGLFRRGAKKRQ